MNYMNAIKLLDFFGRNGIRYTRKTVAQAMDYCQKMLRDDRVVAINDEHGLYTVLMFSICKKPYPYWQKSTWEYMPHDPSETCLYIEKMASLEWHPDLRRTFYGFFRNKYPHLTRCEWHKNHYLKHNLCEWHVNCRMKDIKHVITKRRDENAYVESSLIEQ